MKKLTRFIMTLSLVSVVILSGCGGTNTTTNKTNSDYIEPSFISQESSSVAASEAPTSANTAASGEQRETGTIVPDESITIVAMDNSPYLKGITLKTTLSYLAERYQVAYTYNKATKSYRWDFGDNGTVIAVHYDGYPDEIIEVSYSPADYSLWRDSRNDFSNVDSTKSYKYSEICNIIGSSGTVSKLSRTIMLPNTYHVCWYTQDGQVLYVQFDSATNMSIHIQLL